MLTGLPGYNLALDSILLKFISVLQYHAFWLFLMPILLLFCFFRVKLRGRPIQFFCDDQSFLWKDIFNRTSLKTMVYTPWSFAVSSHIQSLAFPLLELVYQWLYQYKPKREILQYEDGGIIGLDWICFKNLEGKFSRKVSQSSKPILILFPGFMGNHTMLYLISLIKEGVRSGFDCVVPNPRGLGGVPLVVKSNIQGSQTPKLFDGGNTDDYKEIVNYIHKKYCSGKHRRKIFAVGVSIGAGVLSNYMAKEGSKCKLDAAVGLSCIFDSHKGIEHLSTNLFGFYDYMIGICGRITGRPVAIALDRLYQKLCPEKMFLSEYNKVLTLSEDFSQILVKCSGYEDRSAYFDDLMVTPRLKDVKRPFFFLSSKDDQFWGPTVIPYNQKHPYILLGVTKYGGHAMHFEGSLLPTRQWFTDPTFEFLTYFSQES